MLRCDPSRIHLTPADVTSFEHRFTARTRARLTELHRSKARLSPGPGHQTQRMILPSENFSRRIREDSKTGDRGRDSTVGLPDRSSMNCGTRAGNLLLHKQHEKNGDGLVVESSKDISKPQSSSELSPSSPPRQQIDSFFELQRPLTPAKCIDPNNTEPIHEMRIRTSELRLDSPGRLGVQLAPLHRNLYNDETHNDDIHAYPEPRPLSSQRARRRRSGYKRTVEIADYCQVQTQVHRSQHDRSISPSPQGIQPVPSAQWPSSIQQQLDPGAPAFVPRVKLGTASCAAGGLRLQPIESKDGLSPSRIQVRSPSNQNIDRAFESRLEASQDASLEPSEMIIANRIVTLDLQQDRAIDQSERTRGQDAIPEQQPRPPLPANGQRDPSENRSRRINSPRAGISHSLLRTSGNAHAPTTPSLSLSLDNVPVSNFSRKARFDDHSNSQRKNPSLQSSNFHRVPSMISAASGTSGGELLSQRTPGEPLDAATEFLRMRSSPLDSLTEELSRLSSRSSWHDDRRREQRVVSRSRVKLLSGDPFRHESTPESSAINCEDENIEAGQMGVYHRTDSGLDDTSMSQFWHTLPSLQWATSTPQCNPVSPGSGHCSPPDPGVRKDNHIISLPPSSPEKFDTSKNFNGTASTPKMKIYEDSTSSSGQPSKPVQVSKSTRHAKNRSEIVTGNSLITASQHTRLSSPPIIPQRHFNRYTYPTTAPAPALLSFSGITSPQAGSQSPLQDFRRRPTQRSHGEQSTAIDQETDEVESHRDILEYDHRMWLSRRGEGTLDVTPPKEGKFEQYLS